MYFKNKVGNNYVLAHINKIFAGAVHSPSFLFSSNSKYIFL